LEVSFRRRVKDLKRKPVKITPQWLALALLLPLISVVLFTAKPVEAG